MSSDYRKVFSSPELERHSLAGFVKHPNIYIEIDNFIKETDFVYQSNRIIYSVARNLRLSNTRFDAVILAQKIKEIGISFKDDIDVFSYIEVLFSIQISEEATLDAFRQLEKNRILRELCETGDSVKEYVLSNREKNVSAIVGGVGKIYGAKIDYRLDEQPVDLFDGLRDEIENRAKSPIEMGGLKTGYSLYDSFFDGLTYNAGIAAIVSRPGVGKSSYMLQMGRGVLANNPESKVLVLDVEMKGEISRFRLAASLTNVNPWYLRTGNWVKDKELEARINTNLPKELGMKGRFFHLYAGNKPIDEIVSIIRKWYYKYVGTGGKALVIYDYIKLSGEALSKNWSEYQAIGDKCNKLTDVSLELEVPILVATQANRSGEGEDASDDSSIISLSDRLFQVANNTSIFRRKTLKELALYGQGFGTHLLKPLKSRQQGKTAMGHNQYVNMGTAKKPKWQDYFINYDVQNFTVIEKGDARNIAARLSTECDLNAKEYKLEKPKDIF